MRAAFLSVSAIAITPILAVTAQTGSQERAERIKRGSAAIGDAEVLSASALCKLSAAELERLRKAAQAAERLGQKSPIDLGAFKDCPRPKDGNGDSNGNGDTLTDAATGGSPATNTPSLEELCAMSESEVEVIWKANTKEARRLGRPPTIDWDAVKQCFEEAEEAEEVEEVEEAEDVVDVVDVVDVKTDEQIEEQAEQFPPLIMRDPVGLDTKPREVLFFSRADDQRLEDLTNDLGWLAIDGERIEPLGVTMIVLKLPSGQSVSDAIGQLEASDVVEWAQPNHIYWLLGNSRERGLAVHGEKLAAGSGASGVIAMIDSPVDQSNPNFAGASISQELFGGAKGAAGHGTAIAEILIGTGEFGGVAKGARLVSLAAFQPVGIDGWQSETRYMVKALKRAVELRPNVMNLSFGTKRQDDAVTRLLRMLDQNGTCLAAAAGNAPGANVRFPGSLEETIAVTAIDGSRSIYPNASRGGEVDVAAWGVGMSAAVPGGRRTVSGTSFATAVVSGAMLHMPACNSAGRPDVMRDAVRKDALDLGIKGSDPIFGAGLFQLGAQGLASVAPSPATRADPNAGSANFEGGSNVALYSVLGGIGVIGLFVWFLFARRRKEKDSQSPIRR